MARHHTCLTGTYRLAPFGDAHGEYAVKNSRRRVAVLAEMVARHAVSDIVVRTAIEHLQSQGLVRSVRRRDNFVTDRPNLVRVSPERQKASAEASFGNESDRELVVDRDTDQVPATDELASAFGVTAGYMLTHVVTRASEDRRPISISDTYQPVGVTGIADATHFDETLADRLPFPTHADWLRTTPGDLVKTIHQRFYTADGRLMMVSDVSYPQGRYDAFTFRMSLRG